jgi:hypothetical protein
MKVDTSWLIFLFVPNIFFTEVDICLYNDNLYINPYSNKTLVVSLLNNKSLSPTEIKSLSRNICIVSEDLSWIYIYKGTTSFYFTS